MRILVIGIGSIGRRHITNLKSLGHKVLAWDASIPARESIHKELGIQVGFPVLGAWDKVDCCLICTPPDSHLYYATRAVEQGIPVFIEKPISDTLIGVDTLLQLAKSKGVPLQVGYNLRFHSGLQQLKQHIGDIGTPLAFQSHFGQYFPDWRPEQDHKLSYSTKLGILLESSHEFDYARWLLGEAVVMNSHVRNTGTVDFQAEDLADVQLLFNGSIPGSIHLNCIERTYSRWCNVIGSEGTMLWNYQGEAGASFLGKTARFYGVPAPTNMYKEEISSFLKCVTDGTTPEVTGEDGLAALKLVLDAKRLGTL